ncbi:hypothetical protein IGI04_042182 [Brassica rapa subsp. trilocularis]|uniref:Uncharacterized protein n=1 Tax=Brassica rapa subsp. trilocularis TaxID=1813537 RepID=A0ABQ7KKN3_BRACM|nr:hypothetical protein IGI04_042182 [Brassica rapa subsp. trilocularis]
MGLRNRAEPQCGRMDRPPTHAPSLLDLAHGLAQGPNSPWPHGRTSQPATDPDPDHRPKARTVRLGELSLSLYKVKSKFPYVLNLLSRPWNACLDVLRLAGTFPRPKAVATILLRIGGVTATQAPDQFNKHETMLVKKLRRIVGLCNQKSNWKTDETRPRPHKRENLKLGAKRSAGKFAGKVTRKFSGDNPAIDLNPAIDSVGPSSPTLHTPSGIEAHTRRPWLSVAVRQHAQDVCGCPPPHTGPHTGRLWLSISTHISTLVLGLSTLALRVDCSSDFGPRGLSVQYTQDVCGCPLAHTGRPWVSVSPNRTSVAVRVCPCVSVSTHMTTLRTSVGVRQHTQDVCGCPSAHTGRLWIFISKLWTLALPVDCWVIFAHVGCLFSRHKTSVGVRQHTQDVCVCPSVHPRRLWHSVAVRVCKSAHTGRPWLSSSTYIITLVIRLSTLTLPVDCSGDFGPRWAVCSVHTGRPWVAASTHRTSVAVRVSPSVSVCVRQHTQDVRGCPSIHISSRWSFDSARWPFPWTVWVILAHVGCLFSTHRTSVGVRQHTQDVCSCPSEHTGRLWLSVCVRVCPSAHTGRPWLPISTHISTLVLGLSTLTLPVDCSGDFGPRGLSVQYTQAVRGCPPVHTGCPWLSVTLALPVDCLGDFGPRGLSVQYTQDVRGSNTGCPWLPISTHISTLVLGLSKLTLLVDCSGDFGPHGLSIQYTQDVSGCPPAHTGRLWLSVCVIVCPSFREHTGCPWLSISTRISTLVPGLSTLALPVDCLCDFGPRGLYVQYRQDVRGCLPAHTGCPWLSVVVCQHTHDVCVCLCVSVCVLQHTQDVCGSPSANTGRLWLSISKHISTLVLGLRTLSLPVDCWVILAYVGCLFSRHTTSMGVRQHTQDVCVCPSEHTGRPWLSVVFRVCPSAHTGRPWLSSSTHISMLVLGLSTLTLTMDCSGDFGPRGLSVQYTHDVRGCPPAHTGRLWLSVTSVGVRHHTQDVRGCPSAHTGRPWLSVCVRVCPCVSVSTHRTSVGVRQHTQDVHVCPSAHTQDVCGCPCVSVCVRQHTQDVCGRPSVHISARWSLDSALHTGRLWVSASTHRTCVADRGCPSAHTGRLWLSVRVRVCPCVSVSTHRTSVAVTPRSGRLGRGRSLTLLGPLPGRTS